MNISTISWKKRGWSQLARYVAKERGSEQDYGLEIFHNVWASEELEDIVDQFKENDTYRPERKGQKQTGLIHEILSFSGADRDRLTPEIIQTLTEQWLAMRAPNALAYGCVHQDRSHLHVHLMLSANEYQSAKSIHLKRKEYCNSLREIEFFQRKHFPELENSISYTGLMDIPKRDRLTLDHVKELVHEAMGQSSRIDEVNRVLAPYGFEVYEYKGRPAGVRQGNRKFRWKRLGYKQAPELEYPDPEREAVIEEEPSAQTRSEPPAPARDPEEEPARLEGTPTADLPERFDWTGETEMWERELEGRESFLEPDPSLAEPSPAFNFADGVDSSGGTEGGFWEVGYNIYSKTRMAVGLVAQGTRITSKVIGRGISTAYKAVKKSQQARSAVERAESPPEPAKPQAPNRNSPEDQRRILEALLELGETPDRERDFDIER